MAKSAFRSTIFIFFAFLWLLTASAAVYGGGSRDPDLSRADALIKDREYDQAILILSDLARRNPDRFDQVQHRLRKIAKIREEFNRTANQLIDTLLNDPDNSEKILALTRRLSSLENETSPLLSGFLSRTQEIAQFNVTRNQFMRILQRGRELLDRGESAAAIQAYSGGMGFMRSEFFAARYGAEIENGALRETERINSILASFQQNAAQMEAVSAELVRAVNAGETARFQEIINRLTPVIDRFTALKQGLYTSSNTLDRLLDRIRTIDPEIGDRNHLSFISMVINGRQGEPIQEGMLGAFEASWRNSIGLCLSAITSNIRNINSQSLAAFNAEDYPAVAASSGRIQNYAALTPLFFEKHRAFNEGARAQTTTIFQNVILRNDIPSFLEIRALTEANNSLIQAASIAGRRNVDRSSLTRWQSGSISASEALRSEQQVKSTLAGIQTSIEEIVTRANQANTEINTYQNIAHIRNALDAIEKLRSAVRSEELLSAQRYYNIAYHVLQNNLTERRAQMERGRNFLNGQRRTGENNTVVIYRYPSEALEELTAMLAALAVDLQNGNSILEQYRNEPQIIAANANVSGTRSNYQSLVNEIDNIRTQGLALFETARSQTSLAEAHRQEGERLLREAQTAFQRQNYDTARERLQRASERFNNSLEIQESVSMRQSWDNQMIVLGQAINQAENETIITEVRNLLNSARDLYFAGNFQQAEDSLTRARNRWRLTNADENAEVLNWLGIVRTAMSANSSRVIPPTAPLYPEMSQLLSQAQRNFEEGVRHINAGRRTPGLEKFEEARQLTREVRMMFPINQEAGLLELRMEQFTDPAAFNASFEQRLNNAVAGTKQRSMESLADLQNLAEINPRYPNIRAIINQAEIDVGLRPPPPNPADIARSRELTASARRILEGNISTQYEVAITQIDQAIALNPNNTDAARIKDRLLNRMSVPGGIVLTSEDEEDYQRALREFSAGNNLVAYAVVERLLQNPRNRNITKLIELQRRIQSVLL
jgi:tetratricopeptide (TPR) repeat protein